MEKTARLEREMLSYYERCSCSQAGLLGKSRQRSEPSQRTRTRPRCGEETLPRRKKLLLAARVPILGGRAVLLGDARREREKRRDPGRKENSSGFLRRTAKRLSPSIPAKGPSKKKEAEGKRREAIGGILRHEAWTSHRRGLPLSSRGTWSSSHGVHSEKKNILERSREGQLTHEVDGGRARPCVSDVSFYGHLTEKGEIKKTSIRRKKCV